MHLLYKTILEEYDARLTSVVFIPSLDADRQFYMSKAKVGIDVHALNATNYEEKAEETQRQINLTSQFINKITDKTNKQARDGNVRRIKKLVEELQNQLEIIMSKIRIVEREYSQYKNHQYVTFSQINLSFMDRIKAKNAVMIAGIIDIAVVVILVAYKQTKKGKG